MALSAGTYRGRLGDRLYTTELPRAGELIGLRGLGSQLPMDGSGLPIGGSCFSLGPGYGDKCAGRPYYECVAKAGDNVGYQQRCAEAYGVPAYIASMLAFYNKPSVRWTTRIGRVAGITLGVYHGVKRNKGKVWPGIGWGLMGGVFWPVVIPVIFAQGVGKRKAR